MVLRLCPTDIDHHKIAGYIDRMITVLPNDKKRDQRPFGMVERHLSGLILNPILKIVEEMGDPYQANPRLGGMTAYPPKAMAVIHIMKEAEMKTYRKITGYLRMNPSLIRRLGLSMVPSKSTMWRAYGMIPKAYLRKIHMRIIDDIVADSLAEDSTDYASNSLVRWFSIRHDQAMTKRGWIKLYSIIDISTRTILDY